MIKYNMGRDMIQETSRQAAQILSETPSTQRVRVLDSFDLHVMKDDISLTPHLRDEGFWEAWITSWLTKWLRPGMTFIDIGANCGYYTMLAETLVGRWGRVIAYEPNPDYAELLRATRRDNGAQFSIRQLALSDKPGPCLLTVPDNYHGSGSLMTDFEQFEITKVHEVECSTLDIEARHMYLTNHDIIKIDAEGAEEKIFAGGQSILDSDQHTTLLMEYTPGAYSEHFLKYLYVWGEVTQVTDDGEEAPISIEQIVPQLDWIMLVVRRK